MLRQGALGKVPKKYWKKEYAEIIPQYITTLSDEYRVAYADARAKEMKGKREAEERRKKRGKGKNKDKDKEGDKGSDDKEGDDKKATTKGKKRKSQLLTAKFPSCLATNPTWIAMKSKRSTSQLLKPPGARLTWINSNWTGSPS